MISLKTLIGQCANCCQTPPSCASGSILLTASDIVLCATGSCFNTGGAGYLVATILTGVNGIFCLGDLGIPPDEGIAWDGNIGTISASLFATADCSGDPVVTGTFDVFANVFNPPGTSDYYFFIEFQMGGAIYLIFGGNEGDGEVKAKLDTPTGNHLVCGALTGSEPVLSQAGIILLELVP